jgi:hypothetical protein
MAVAKQLAVLAQYATSRKCCKRNTSDRKHIVHTLNNKYPKDTRFEYEIARKLHRFDQIAFQMTNEQIRIKTPNV